VVRVAREVRMMRKSRGESGTRKGAAKATPTRRPTPTKRSARSTHPELKELPRQKQRYPGKTAKMEPRPDHGEQTYVGSGKMKGRKALITGGDSGIGRAVAIAFAREGADVAIVYDRSEDDARETCQWVEAAGRKAVPIQADLRTRDACRDAVKRAVKALGGLDVVVNNAGFHQEVSDLSELTEEQLRRTFATNIEAPIWITQAALEHLGDGAAIVNTGSVVALEGNPSLPDYAATKGALHNFTRTMAKMLADRGIRVNTVAPGPVWTPLIAYGRKSRKQASFGQDTAWGRAAQPAELAPSYVFLASDDGRYYTGETFAMTGGTPSR
jgi:NAD(P)-dependent dehydrogenase (short-subunit alcohol dehydrogenase family)